MAQNDTQWLGAQTSDALTAHIATGDTLTLVDFPPHATVFVDGREYSQGLRCVRGLSPNAMHLVALSLLAPGARVGVFVAALAGGHATVRYDDVLCTLTSAEGPTPGDLPGIGSRGVAVQTGPARTDWDALAGQVCSGALKVAQMQTGQGTTTPVFEPWSPARPPAGCTPAERTRFGMDKTPFVLAFVAKRYDGRFSGLLGELQVAFLTFLYLGDADALAHWARGIILLCSCFSLFEDSSEAHDAFTAALATQLPFIDDEVRTVFKGLGLTTALRQFGQYFKDSSAKDAIRVWIADDDASSDEAGPTVVDLS